MAAGLGHLRLRPADFWAMTPREFAAAMQGVHGRSLRNPMQRRDLLQLMNRFPDGSASREAGRQ